MIVWGGRSGTGRDFNDGSRYTVALDTDGDGVLDQDDCDPWDPAVASPPAEASALVFDADKTTLTWHLPWRVERVRLPPTAGVAHQGGPPRRVRASSALVENRSECF